MTMKDVAKKCGVSYMTVSRAINGSELIAEKTKERVLAACEEMNYFPNSAAKSLVTKETGMVGLVVPDIDYYYADVIKRISLYLENRGYGLLLCDYDENPKTEKKYLNYLLQGRVDGVLLFPYDPEKQDYDNVVKKMPTVFVNKMVEYLTASFVGSDNYIGSKSLIDHMLDKGYRRIGVIYGDLRLTPFADRMRGYRDALARRDVAFCEDITYKSSLYFEDGYRGAEYLLEKKVDAIFSFNDVCALGVMKFCAERGISVPGDLGVAGYDNIKYLEMVEHKLTTVDYNGPLVGEQAAAILLDEIKEPSLPKRNIILNPNLIIGETT